MSCPVSTAGNFAHIAKGPSAVEWWSNYRVFITQENMTYTLLAQFSQAEQAENVRALLAWFLPSFFRVELSSLSIFSLSLSLSPTPPVEAVS